MWSKDAIHDLEAIDHVPPILGLFKHEMRAVEIIDCEIGNIIVLYSNGLGLILLVDDHPAIVLGSVHSFELLFLWVTQLDYNCAFIIELLLG